jgi:microcystin-dependent protein
MTTKVSLIADNAIVSAGISNETITNDDIKDSTITTDKIAFGSALVPLGGIIMWSGSTAPSGYQLCNGDNLPDKSPLRPGITKTPDLRDKFIVGATSEGDGIYPGVGVNQTGGSADAVVVSHTHSGTTEGHSVDHTHNFQNFYYAENNGNSGLTNSYAGSNKGNDYDNNPFYVDWVTAGTNSDHTHDFTTSNAKNGTVDIGASAANANLPPYYALAFIMRIS